MGGNVPPRQDGCAGRQQRGLDVAGYPQFFFEAGGIGRFLLQQGVFDGATDLTGQPTKQFLFAFAKGALRDVVIGHQNPRRATAPAGNQNQYMPAVEGLHGGIVPQR